VVHSRGLRDGGGVGHTGKKTSIEWRGEAQKRINVPISPILKRKSFKSSNGQPLGAAQASEKKNGKEEWNWVVKPHFSG